MKKLLQKIKRFKMPPRVLAVAAAALTVGVVIGGALGLHYYLHRSDIAPNTGSYTTGMSLVFNPALKDTAKLEIDDSNEKLVKTVNLVRAKSKDTAHSIGNPLGVKYNISLDEGVYRVKVTSSQNDFPPFVSTVTVPHHTVATVNIRSGVYPQ